MGLDRKTMDILRRMISEEEQCVTSSHKKISLCFIRIHNGLFRTYIQGCICETNRYRSHVIFQLLPYFTHKRQNIKERKNYIKLLLDCIIWNNASKITIEKKGKTRRQRWM